MQIFLDGATGYLGSAIGRALLSRGHEVQAHVRTKAGAETVSALGLSPRLGDLSNAEWLADVLRDVDGAVHAASPNDEHSAALDTAVLDVVLREFAGTPRPYVHTGGSWIHGSGSALTEQSPFGPPGIVAWRPAIVNRVLAARDVRGAVVAPANLFGYGGGLVSMLLHGPQRDGALCFPGGDQHFPVVHVDDAARLFALTLESEPQGAYYLAATESLPMREVAGAASRLAGRGGRIRGESREAARSRLGPIADALLLDARIDASYARQRLDWNPTGPSLLHELTVGSYASGAGSAITAR